MPNFLNPSELDDFVRESADEARLTESLLQFELRDILPLHFCGWCGLGAHARAECPHGN